MARVNIVKQIKIGRQWVFKRFRAKKMGSEIGTPCRRADISSNGAKAEPGDACRRAAPFRKPSRRAESRKQNSPPRR